MCRRSIFTILKDPAQDGQQKRKCRSVSKCAYWVLNLALILSSLHSASAQIIWSDSLVSVSNYDGFDSSFDPYWIGDTDLIYYVPGNAAIDIAFEYEFPAWSIPVDPNRNIQLTSSNREVSTSTSAVVREGGFEEGRASDGTKETEPNAEDFDVELHRYARVVNQDWLELARGNAVSEQDSAVTDSEFRVQGRIGADTMLLDSLSGYFTKAEAYAANTVELTYLVNEETDFTLSGTMAQHFDIDMMFSIVDVGTDATIYSVAAEDRLDKSFHMVGTLLPGEYEFRVDAKADSVLAPSRILAQSGLGEYSLEFIAEVHGGAVSSDPFTNYQSRGGDVLARASVPEPMSLSWLALSIFAGILRSRKQRGRQA